MSNSYSGGNIWKSITEFGTNVWDGGVDLYKGFATRADDALTGFLSRGEDVNKYDSYGEYARKVQQSGTDRPADRYASYQQSYYNQPYTSQQAKEGFKGFNAWENTKKFVGNLYDKTPDWAKKAGAGFIKGALGIPLKMKELELQKEYGKSQESAMRSFLAGAKNRFRLSGIDMSGGRGGPGFGFARNVGNFSSNYTGNPASSKIINDVAYNEKIRERLLREIGRGKNTIVLGNVNSRIGTKLTPKI